MLGFWPLAARSVSEVNYLTAEATAAFAAGGPGASATSAKRRHRYQVEFRDEVIDFDNAEDAYNWLKAQVDADEELKRQQKPKKNKRAIEVVNIDKPVVRYAGEDVSFVRLHRQDVTDYLLQGLRLRVLDEYLANRAREEDDDSEALLLMH